MNRNALCVVMWCAVVWSNACLNFARFQDYTCSVFCCVFGCMCMRQNTTHTVKSGAQSRGPGLRKCDFEGPLDPYDDVTESRGGLQLCMALANSYCHA